MGRILRKTHLDEFPQFLNILKGEMSAVGRRPERPEFVEELAREIPFYRRRHAVKPPLNINSVNPARKLTALCSIVSVTKPR